MDNEEMKKLAMMVAVEVTALMRQEERVEQRGITVSVPDKVEEVRYESK